MIHLLGFGQADSFDGLISGGAFTGPSAVAAFGGPVPLQGDLGHYQQGTESFGAVAVMNSVQRVGTRAFVTALDWGVLRDVGWEFTPPAFTRTGLPADPPDAPPSGPRTLTATVTPVAGAGRPTGAVTFTAVSIAPASTARRSGRARRSSRSSASRRPRPT